MSDYLIVPNQLNPHEQIQLSYLDSNTHLNENNQLNDKYIRFMKKDLDFLEKYKQRIEPKGFCQKIKKILCEDYSTTIVALNYAIEEKKEEKKKTKTIADKL
ncbi:MAG: hypothetical protein ACLFN8_02405 [Candidatus Woesearchaeota archaeon]